MNKIEVKPQGGAMKTLTLRVDDHIYNMIKTAADGQKCPIANFIEFVTLQYFISE